MSDAVPMSSTFSVSGVGMEKLVLGFAPFSSRLKAQSILSRQIASCIGIQPLVSAMLMSQPCFRRQSTTCRCPDFDAL